MRVPKEFERVAQEWAVKYAGAPKKERGENSGGATTETLKQRQQKSKEEEQRERIAQLVTSSPISLPLMTLISLQIWRLQ